MPDHERCAETGGECSLRLGNPDFRSRNFGSISRNEVIHRLLGRESGHRRQHAKGITCQKNNVGRVSSNTRYFRILDEFDRVRAAGVLSYAGIGEVNLVALVIKDHILKNGPEMQGVKDFRLRFFRQIDRFRITTAFNVEYSRVTPDMLIISDQPALRVSR